MLIILFITSMIYYLFDWDVDTLRLTDCKLSSWIYV